MSGFRTVVGKAARPRCGGVVGSVHVTSGHEKTEKIRFFMNILLHIENVNPWLLSYNYFLPVFENNICQHEPQWQWGRFEWEKMKLSLDSCSISSIVIFLLGKIVLCAPREAQASLWFLFRSPGAVWGRLRTSWLQNTNPLGFHEEWIVF